MNFSKAGPEVLVDVPALQHEVVQVPVAVPGGGEGGGGLGVEGGQQGGVCQVLVRSDTSEVEDLPEQNSE